MTSRRAARRHSDRSRRRQRPRFRPRGRGDRHDDPLRPLPILGRDTSLFWRRRMCLGVFESSRWLFKTPHTRLEDSKEMQSFVAVKPATTWQTSCPRRSGLESDPAASVDLPDDRQKSNEGKVTANLTRRQFNSLLAAIPASASVKAPLRAWPQSTADAVFPRAKGRYEPSWESIATRPIPAWYTEARFGISMHWGRPNTCHAEGIRP